MECPTVIILFHHTTIWQLGVLYSDIVLLAAIVLKPETICRYYPKSKIADEHKCRQISQFRMQYTNSGIGYYSSSERKKYSQTCQKSLKHGSNAKNQDHGSTATQYQSSIVASSTGDAEASRWRVTYPYSASKRFLRFNTVL